MTMHFLKLLEKSLEDRLINKKIHDIFVNFYLTYAQSISSKGLSMEEHDHLFDTFLTLVEQEYPSPHSFLPFHKKITQPFNYYKFGIEFVRPLVDNKSSRTLHPENIKKISDQIRAKENVILFANHQTEVDPQLLSIALEESYPDLATEVIFVAGDRVISDPMAVPFSMGRNLLCIYSKRYIDIPPEKKFEKQQHNQRTMKKMKELLSEGGQFIYVAPSGGRDRPNEKGEVPVSTFDPQSVEMFRLMAKQAGQMTHFYPLALATYEILPPPRRISTELGEERNANRSGAFFSFGAEIDLDHIPDLDQHDRYTGRIIRANYIQDLVNNEYDRLMTLKKALT